MLLGFVVSVPLVAQQAEGLKATDKSILATVDHFGLSDGLMLDCLDRGFKDKAGRLWLNPCDESAIGLGFSFFQFDGTKSFSYNFQPDWTNNNDRSYAWKLSGIADDGTLYGLNYQQKTGEEVIFQWHPDTNEQAYYQLKTGEILIGLHANHENVLFALLRKGDTFQIISNSSGSWVKNAALPFPSKARELFQFPYGFSFVGDKAWFFYENEGMVCIDFKTQEMRFQTWKDLNPSANIQPHWSDLCCEVQPWKMMALPNGKLLMYLGIKNGFFTYDTESSVLTPLANLNQGTIAKRPGALFKIHLAQDDLGNVLIISATVNTTGVPTNDFDVLEAWIWKRDGSWRNISETLLDDDVYLGIHAFERPDKFISSNLNYEMSWVTENGLFTAALSPDLQIKTYKKLEAYRVGMRSINYLSQQRLLVNTDFQNIDELDLNTGQFKPFKGMKMEALPLSKVVKQGGNLWAAQRNNTMLKCDLDNLFCEQIDLGIYSEKFLFLDANTMFLASKYGELYTYNTNTKVLSQIESGTAPIGINSEVTDIKLADNGLIWLSALNGLWSFDSANKVLKDYKTIHPLLGESLMTIHINQDGRLWLGSSKQGVVIFDTTSNTIQQIKSTNGLSNNTVVSLLEDNDNYKWAATYSGISVMDNNGVVQFTLDQSDGLSDHEFNRMSSKKLPDGRLVFGGINGLNILNPKVIIKTLSDRNQNKLYLTGIEYYDKQKASRTSLSSNTLLNSPILISAEANYLKLDYAQSVYTNIERHNYAYRIIPIQTDEFQEIETPWINLGNSSELTINNLPSGDFNIQIIGFDEHSNQSLSPLEIPVSVQAFFYQKWWFYALILIPFLLFTIAWLRRNKQEKKRLQLEVERRTQQIQKDKSTIENQANRLAYLDRAKTRFFTNISHEFRTPLTVIIGILDQIKGFEGPKELIRRNSRQILGLVNQILDLRKLESGKMHAHYQQGDLVTYLQYLLESFHSLAEDKRITLTLECKQNSLLADYDPEKLRHILSNLLSNAIKHTPEAGQVKLFLEEISESNTPRYRLSVSDTGKGIPADQLSHIFDRFYQVEDEISQTGVGTGLGLTLVKELVQLLDGEISVESDTEHGTRFTVELPLTRNANIQTSLRKQHIPLKSQTSGADPILVQHNNAKELPVLLIVEDNSDVREYLVITLRGTLECVQAKNGNEGLQKAIEIVPDVIISDVMMPGMDGFALCQALKSDERTSHIPVILLTAKADIASKVAGLVEGADAYLTKPFHERELRAQLKNLLNLRQKLQERYKNLEHLEPSQNPKLAQEDVFLLKARQIIQEHLGDESFGVRQMCQELAMSRTQLHNKIKALTNQSTTRLIRKIRINKAKELLKTSNLNISEIATEVGISSIQYFSKMFHEETGLSPKHFREQIQSKD
ncbi:response regulator [Winogradskyella sp. DF17]|uniref:histidine kinase n=1 Tax=Winogradskyella pelagia TaxID=2819984 RepID=A0ABS3T165_9FLAO|nr:hybrid sensor histidine kinase/response regulator transcription factor [Winogradskyella sp. DF17]MBO3116491.1 response regulator [Winogradskyella sp. DF17]